VSNFKLEFTLKQHTPIIHFQSEQKGATLRATELKPKLDKFLIEYAFGDDFDRYKSFLIGYESVKKLKKREPKKSDFDDKLAFDYKVKISVDSNKIENIEKRNPRTGREIKNPLFFGNMGDGDVHKKRFILSKKIMISFFSFNRILLDSINNNFEAFLANTNFGTRQSKGFGSFYIETKDFNSSLVKATVYFFDSTPNQYQEDINLFYSFLRSGINVVNFRTKESRFYAKALSFMYAKEHNMTWDKKAIKQKYFQRDLKQQQNRYRQKENCLNYNSNNEYLIRDLFGLSSEQRWMSYRANISKEHNEKNKNKKIERFKSPIIFKPIIEHDRVKVYFWADSNIKAFLDKEFVIKNNKRGDLKLSTPSTFSFEEFFKFAFSIDISSHIDNQYHNTNEYQKLNRVFNQLRSQL
jgi:hypothetical protein